jgi:hypothetical protein
MRAACRHCRLHHTKRNFSPLKGTQTAGAHIEQNTCHACHEDGCAIQPNNPTSVHFPDVSCGLWRRLTRRSLYVLATWRKGGVRRFSVFEGPASLESSSVTRCYARAQASGLSSKMAASQELTACRDLAATPLGRRSGRRPDVIGAAQHPGIERRANSRVIALLGCAWSLVDSDRLRVT